MRFHWVHLACVTVVFSISCDEALPPRTNPSNLIVVTLQPSYVYSQFENDVIINLTAINKFDETMSDRIGIAGTIVVTSDRDTSVHKTYQLSSTNLVHGNFNAFTGTLTIDPGDSVVLQVRWNFTDDSGNSLISSFFHYSVDRACQERDVAMQESFSIAAKMKLYSQLGYAQSQTPFTIVQYDRFVGPHDCIPL